MAKKDTKINTTIHPKTNTTSSAKSGRITSKATSGGVVAYTKGSRFKDAEVQAVVQRVLKTS